MEEPRYDTCFACGKDNAVGLKLEFSYVGDKAVAEFTSPACYEGYRGVIHGGIITTLMDEAMAKAILISGKKAVTAQITTHFRKPLRTGLRVLASGWITASKTRTIKTAAQIADATGSVIATAEAVFIVSGI
ncbi:MAG: PaaI family thioesterase [Candidatus Neomarinimicrobiota bacterium]|nr:PaaI family thioesterase [Candidatus Cloacimonadota bacterium]